MNRREFVSQMGRGAIVLALTGETLARAGESEASGAINDPAGPGAAVPESGLARGWNTWSTQSVLTHVLLPEGLALKLSFFHFGMLAMVKDGFFGAKEQTATAGVHLSGAPIKSREIRLRAGRHAYDGAYTALTLTLGEVTVTVESAHDGPRGLVLWITASRADHRPPALVVEPGFLWNRSGRIEPAGDRGMTAVCPDAELAICATAASREEPNLASISPAWVFPLSESIGLSVGAARTREEISKLVAEARQAEAEAHARYGASAELHAATQAALAWNTIYEPAGRRVITTSSRQWNVARLGFGIFCWDSFFYGWMVSIDRPELGRSCVREVLRGMIDGEFVPNVINGSGRRSADRSQPCIGGMAVLAMHEIAPDHGFLEQVWPSLLNWNRWWHQARRNASGLLSWGSNPAPIEIGDLAESLQPNCLRGASLESGMDNTPMYDGIPFDDRVSHLMALSDVGLASLYVADCEALSVLAAARQDAAAGAELKGRAREYGAKLATLWNEGAGIFENRRVDTGQFSERLSPTCFYPMLAGVATSDQSATMIRRYLLNPDKFWGEWVLPSVPRDDPAFGDQVYWRGRIWAPLNFFVYLGLKRAGFDQPAAELAERSRRLFELNWRKNGDVFENFSPLDGQGGGVLYSDAFYPWTGLLVMIDLMEKGLVPLPSVLRPHKAAVNPAAAL